MMSSKRCLVWIVVILFSASLYGQEWVTGAVPGAKNPAEIAGDYVSPSAGFAQFARIFMVWEDDGGTKLDYVRHPVDNPSAAVITTIPNETSFVFGMGHQIVTTEEASYVAYIDGGKVIALRSTDGGETWTRFVVADSISYGEVQISPTVLGPLIAAYNFRLHQIELYRFIVTSLVWNSMGSVLAGRVFGAIDSKARMTLDSDERKDDILLGWSEPFEDGYTYFVGRFAFPALTAMGSPVRIPVKYPIGMRELQMARADGHVAGLSAVGDRYKLFTFPYKQPQRQAPTTVTLHDLGPARSNTVGGIALMEGGARSWYTATATPGGDIDYRQYHWVDSVIQMRSLTSVRGAHPDPTTDVLPYSLNIMGRGAEMRMRHYYRGSLSFAQFTGCVDSRRRLCSNAHRFDVSVNWRDPAGNTGFGRAIPLTSDTGYFWFFNDDNIEMVIKVLNGCTINQRYWVFAGGLTNVEVDITVRDSQTGAVKTYRNPQGTAFQPIQDTSAFEGCTAGTSLAMEPATLDWPPERSIQPQQGPCVPSETALCVNGGRFRVEANWRAPQGATGTGKAIPLTADSGYFWFFSPNNVELLAKVLNACVPPFNHHWVFAAGLTNVEVELIVTDVATGAVKRYTNPQGTAYQPIQDTGAFATCP